MSENAIIYDFIDEGTVYIDDDRAVWEYLDCIMDAEYTVETFEEAYCGKWDSENEFAQDLVHQTGMIPEGFPEFYFDYDAFTRDLFMTDYFMTPSGFVFRNL